jgi:hypothetical protein
MPKDMAFGPDSLAGNFSVYPLPGSEAGSSPALPERGIYAASARDVSKWS